MYQDPLQKSKNLILHYGDMTDSLSLQRIIDRIQPDEIYNLAAQSHVAVSFNQPEYTANSDALGTLRILETIRKAKKKLNFIKQAHQKCLARFRKFLKQKKTNFYPRSPYAAAKLYAHWITINYREAYGIFACNGILFNHESPKRGNFCYKNYKGFVQNKT